MKTRKDKAIEGFASGVLKIAERILTTDFGDAETQAQRISIVFAGWLSSGKSLNEFMTMKWQYDGDNI